MGLGLLLREGGNGRGRVSGKGEEQGINDEKRRGESEEKTKGGKGVGSTHFSYVSGVYMTVSHVFGKN